MNWCRRALALLDVPKCTRAAMPLSECVGSWRNRAASASLPRSLLCRPASSARLHPSRLSSSPLMRSAFASAGSQRNSPEGGSPSLPSTFSNIWRWNSLRSKHQPRRSPFRASGSVSASRRAAIRRSNSSRLAAVSCCRPCSPNNRSTRTQCGRSSGAAK